MISEIEVIIIIYITGTIALKSSGARPQMRHKTKSLIIFKSREHIGVIVSLKGRRLFKVEKSNFEEINLEIFTKRGKTFTRLVWLVVHSK